MNPLRAFAAAIAVTAAMGCMAQSRPAPATPSDSAAAAIATVWANHLRPSLLRQLGDIQSLGVAVDQQAFFGYIADALQGRYTGFDYNSANAYMERRVMSASASDSVYAADQAAWLKEMAAKPGVTVTSSGLIFEVVIEGEGASPVMDDVVTCNYIGRLSDGSVFDQNQPDHPAVFAVGALIKGFNEGLMMMKPGGTYRMYIPADLGYGNRGAGGKIKPGAALDFTVELLSIQPKPQAN